MNTISIVLLGVYGASRMDPLIFAVVVVSMAVVHTFLDILPAIFLGAPDPDTALSILPGHRMLLDGRGLEAVRLSVMGSLGAVVLAACTTPLVVVALPALYPIVSTVMFPLLAFLEVSIIMTERDLAHILWAVVVLAASGFLGLVVMSSGLISPQKGFFPALSGLFGVSTLLLASRSGMSIPSQAVDWSTKLERRRTIRSVVVGFFCGMVTGVLPAVGSAHATIMAQRVTGDGDHRSFIVSVSGVNTSNMIFGLVALYAIGKARNGAVKAVQQILGEVGDPQVLALLVSVAVACGGIGAFLTMLLGRVFATNITKIPYDLLSRMVIAAVSFLVALECGWVGLLILASSTFIGLIPPLVGVKRVHCMGFLMVPTLMYFSGYHQWFLRLLLG